MKVLIAEDDAVSRTILKKTVERFGHECLVTKDGAEAWDLFQNTSDVDVIVSDWMMPNVDGLEFCRRVRGIDPPRCNTFFVFLTALGGKEHLLEGMEAGADEYLTKPLDSEQLRAKLLAASRIMTTHQHLNGGAVARLPPGMAPRVRARTGTERPGCRAGASRVSGAARPGISLSPRTR